MVGIGFGEAPEYPPWNHNMTPPVNIQMYFLKGMDALRNLSSSFRFVLIICAAPAGEPCERVA